MGVSDTTVRVTIESELKPIPKNELSDYKNQLDEINKVTPFADLNQDSMWGFVPNVARSFVDTMRQSLLSKYTDIQKIMDGAANGKTFSKDVVSGLKEGIGFLAAGMKSLFSVNGAFGSIVGNLSKEIAQDFEKEFVDITKSASSILLQSVNRSKASPMSDNAYQHMLLQNRTFSAGLNAIQNKYALTSEQSSGLVKGIVQMVVPAHMRKSYFENVSDNSLGKIKQRKIIPEYNTWKERLPERYQSVPDKIVHASQDELKAVKGFLTNEQYKIVKEEARNNYALQQALIMTGHAKRVPYKNPKTGETHAGELVMPERMSIKAYRTMLGALDEHVLRPALEGAPAFRQSLSNTNGYVQHNMANKTSHLPTESFAAFSTLSSIPYAPLYVDVPSKPRYLHRLANSVGLNSNPEIRPATYQIMSLTPEDFAKGVVLDPKVGAAQIYGEKATGVSTNRMISRSAYTDMLGMFGHNTYGNGSYEAPSKPAVLQMDLSDRIFLKDKATGKYEWEDGKVKANPETMQLLEDIFTRNATGTTKSGKTFSYPTWKYGETNYVPTTIHKNGLIDFAREDAYLAKASEFIDKYGVDVFENLVSPDEEFETVKGLNKPLEARNRFHTPSVPFSELGGRMPGKRNTAFVDLESITGLNGASVFMPGFLPADALTLRSVGFKGSGFSSDFKQYIRDVYGEDVKEFYAPAWNASDALKAIFSGDAEKIKKNAPAWTENIGTGIDAIRKIYANPELAKRFGAGNFNEEFVDIMKYDALIDASLNKTPFYNGLSHTRTQDLFFDILDMIGGMRGVQTDRGFFSKSDSISRQISQNLRMTDEQVKENEAKWNDWLFTLRNDPEKTIDKLFSDENNPLDKRVKQDHSLLFSDPDAIKRVNDAIEDAEAAKREKRLFSKDDAFNLMALPNIGEIFGILATANKKDVKNADIARIMGLGYNDPDIVSGQKNAKVAIPAWIDEKEVAAWRYPNNLAEQFILENTPEYVEYLKKYRMSLKAAYMNMKTIDKMGGGDVDGDTIQAARKRFVEMVRKTYAEHTPGVEANRGILPQPEDIKFPEGKRKATPHDYAETVYRKAASVFRMSEDSAAGDALSQVDWNDPETKKYYERAGADIRAAYDIDTVFAKTGVLAEWSRYTQHAKNLGLPFVQAFKDIQGAVKENNFDRIKDFSKVNFPSIYDAQTVNYLMSLATSPYSDYAVDEIIRRQEEMQGIANLDERDPIQRAKRDYLRKNNEIMARMATGRGQIAATTDNDLLDSLLANWSSLVTQREKLNISDEERSYLKDQMAEIKFQRHRLEHRDLFSTTERNVSRGEGYAEILKPGRLTNDYSAFEIAANAEQDKLFAEMAEAAARNPVFAKAVEDAGIQSVSNGSFARAQNKGYSWTEVHTVENGESGPLNWYDRYWLKNSQDETRDIVLGLGVHEALQKWAERRIANNEDYGTSKEFEEIFTSYLKEYQTKNSKKKLFSSLPSEDESLFSKDEITRYNKALEFVRNLPNFMKDEIIEASEELVYPYLGKKMGTDISLSTSGKLDLRTRNITTGKRTIWDLKPLLEESLKDQPTLYAGALGEDIPVDFVGLIGYLEALTGNKSRSPFSKQRLSDVTRRAENITNAIQMFGRMGAPEQAIADGLFSSVVIPKDKRNIHYYRAEPVVQQEQSVLERPAAPSSLPGYQEFVQASVYGNVSPNGMPNNPPKDEKDATPVYVTNGETMAQRNAQETAARRVFDDEINKLDSMRNMFISKERKIGSDDEFSIWDKWDFQTNADTANRIRERMMRTGVSKENIAQFDEYFQETREAYEKFLTASASADLVDYTANNEDTLLRSKAKTSRGFVDALRKSDEDFETASAAYKKLLAKENKTEDDNKALEEAKAAKERAEQSKNRLDQSITEEATSALNNEIDQFVYSLKGKGISQEDRKASQVSKLTRQRDQKLSDLEYLRENKAIKEQDYLQQKQRLEYFSNDLLNSIVGAQTSAQARLENVQKESIYNNLRIRQNQLERRKFRAGNSYADRILSNRESQIQGWQSIKTETEKQLAEEKIKFSSMKQGDNGYFETKQKIEELQSASNNASKEIEKLSGVGGLANATFATFDQTLGMVARRLGRRLFYKALQETKRFVKEFDASMNEIQAITLKSDKEMQSIRSQTINKALGLRTSVSNVSNVEAALYRQGLSDQEVSARTESIIKFATVTKLNVQEATKIITTALQNDLVNSANEAMDALVALGDSAATTAAEIGKGMQKAAAAAKVAGVSYSELTALLTIGTSDTQLSGTQVGTALQTVFTRMRRLSVNGWTADQNGEKTTANDAEAALAAVGVDLWDDKALGKMRSAYDVLLDLSKVWQNLSDAQKNIVMNAMAGTRQTNVFATLMEGMSEDNGATLEKYFGFSEGSEGITQSKYEIAMQSLAAAMDTLKSSWDSVVESFTNSGLITGVLDGVSGFLQSISETASNGGQIGIGLSAIAAGITALIASLVPGGNVLAIIGGIATFLAGSGINSLIFGNNETQTEISQKALNDISYINKNNEAEITQKKKLIDDVKKAGKAWNKTNNTETTDNLTVSLEKLSEAFPSLSEEIQDALSNLNGWTKAVEEAQKATDDFSRKSAQKVIDATIDYVQTVLPGDYASYMEDEFVSNEERNNVKKAFASALYYDEHPYEITTNAFANARQAFEFTNAKNYQKDLTSDKDKAKALTVAYRSSNIFKNFADKYLNNATKEILNDTTNETPYEQSGFAANAASELNRILTALDTDNAWTIQTSMSDALSFRASKGVEADTIKRYLKYGVLDYSALSKANNRDKAVILSQAMLGSPELLKWISSKNGGANLISQITYTDETSGALKLTGNELSHKPELVQLTNELIEESNTSSKRQATTAFLKEKLPQALAEDFALMAESSSRFDVNKIQELFIESLTDAMNTDSAKYFNTDGTYNQAAVEEFVKNFLDGWYTNTVGFLNDTAARVFTYDKFAYHFYENDANTWFDDYNEALEYAYQHNIDPNLLKTSTGASAFQGTSMLLQSKQIEANATNKSKIISQLLYGSEINLKTVPQWIKEGVAKNLEYQGIGDYESNLSSITSGELTFENLPQKTKDILNGLPSLKAKSIDEYSSFDDLFRAYENVNQQAVLSNYIAGDANAMTAYLNGDYEQFKKAIREADAGKSTPQSRAELMRSFGESFIASPDKIYKFINDSLTSDAYKTWQSFFGENADAILQAMASPEGLQGDLLEYYNRTLAEKGIATGTGLKQFTGVETAKLAQTVLDIGDWTKAQETSSERGWTTDEWAALENKYPDLKRYLQMTQEQRESEEGKNLKRNLDIQLSVAGLSDLEEAGKVLEGTTNYVKQLQENNVIKLKAQIDFETNLQSMSQLGARLNSTNPNEVIQALLESGISQQTIETDFEGALAQGKAQQQEKVNQAAETIRQLLLRGNVAEAYANANAGGFVLNAEEALKNINEKYKTNYQYDSETDELYYVNSLGERKKAENTSVNKDFYDALIQYQGNDVYYTNPNTGKTINYSASKVADMQLQMLNENFDRQSVEDHDLLAEAERKAGEKLGNYLTLVANNASNKEINDARAAALREVRQSQREAFSSDLSTRLSVDPDDIIRANASLIAQNASTMLYGTATQQNELFNTTAVQSMAAQNALYAFKNLGNTEDSRRLINSFIGIDEEVLKTKLDDKTGTGRAEIEKQINDKIKEAQTIFSESLFAVLPAGADFDIDFSNTENAKEQVEKALKDTDQSIASLFSAWFEALTGIRVKIYDSIADINKTETDEAQKRTDAYNAIGSLFNVSDEEFYDKAQTLYRDRNIDSKYLSPMLRYMIEAASYNDDRRFSREDMKAAYEADMYGRAIGGETQTSILNSLFNGDLSAVNMVGTYQKWLDNEAGYATELNVFKQLPGFNNFNDIINNVSNIQDIERWTEAVRLMKTEELGVDEAIEKAGISTERFNKISSDLALEITKRNVTAMNKYGSSTESVVSAMDMFSSDVKKANTAARSFNSTLSSISQNQYFREQFRKGNRSDETVSSIASQLNLSEAFVKDKANEGLISGMLEAAETEDVSSIQAYADSISDQLSSKLKENVKNGITLEGFGIDVSSGDVNVDFSAAESMLSKELVETYNNMVALLESMQVTSHLESIEDADGNTVGLRLVVDDLGGGYKGSKGGGGGKSAADKLLEEQKRKLAELEHQQKMLEIAEKGLDFSNAYSGWNTNLDEQIVVQEKLRTQYSENIKEMDDMLKHVEEGSDDWYKLKEAIMSAEEALASINNTINEINEKRISILSQEQENADKPDAHRLSMQQKFAARYQRSDQFEGYVAMTELALETTRKQIEQNNSQIKDWEDLLLEFEENSDSWIETRDNIWKLKEENADLENQVASDMIDLQEARIAQIAKDLESAQSPYEHAVNMLDIYGGMYQSLNDQAGYRSTLQDTIANNNQLKSLNDAAIEELKQQIEGMKESDPARQSAISTLYQLEEASARYEASMLSNQQAIEESLISELQTTYSDSGSILEHELRLLSEAEKEYLRNDDFVNYENILNEKARNAAEQLENQKNALNDYIALQQSGQITEGSQQWKDLENTIRSTKESIAELSNTYQESVAAVQKAQFDNAQKRYQEIVDQTEHELNLIRYQQTLYQNRGELTNYGTALTWENTDLRERQSQIADQINTLKELQEIHKDNPELYDQETNAIRKLEEEQAKLTVEVEKNEKAQRKNIDAILQVKATVLNTIDSAIRENIQKEKTMLSATVSMQNTILDTIRKSYQEQWALERKTLEQKKQNLNDEKNLISERVNFRKKMMDQENKDEELAELKRQYTLISADSTRTKEANEILRQIREMEKEQAIQDAEDIANAEIKSRDDQIKALDNYISTSEEDLSNYLKQANNFREELDNIFQGSYEEYVEWYSQTNSDFKNMTSEQQEKMRQDFEDQWKEAFGLITTYWEQANDVVKSKEGFIAYATSLDSFRKKSEEEQQIYIHTLEDQWDAWQASLVDNAEFTDLHDITSAIEDLKEWTFSVNIANLDDYDFGPFSDYTYNRRRDYDPYVDDDDYSGRGKQPEPEPTTPTPPPSSSGTKTTGKKYYLYDASGRHVNTITANSDEEANSYAKKNYNIATYASTNKPVENFDPYSPKKVYGPEEDVEDISDIYDKIKTFANSMGAAAKLAIANSYSITDLRKPIEAFASGGLVDYTGPAWVDGTKMRPESFLDSTDTSLLRSMLDSFTYIKNSPYMTSIDSSNYHKPTISVGDVNVNLYEAKLENDADYSKIAAKVGEVFTKELQKDGFNLANYTW